MIFIHIPKCAGISMWNALDLDISPDNLISLTPPVLQHLLPKQLKGKYIDTKTWNEYKKITIIRNPYDRVISDYFWMKANAEASRLTTGTFDDFLSLREDVVRNNKYQEDMYYDHFYPMSFYFEGIKYDHILRFENINEEYDALRNIYKIEKQLPKVNESNREGFVLSNEQQERIYNLYKKDFQLFNYSKKYLPFELKNKKMNEIFDVQIEKHLLQNEQITLKSIPVLKHAKVQIYWANSDCSFSEAKSIVHVCSPDDFGKPMTFNLVSAEREIEIVRFDIGSELGLLNIRQIIIKNKEGRPVWDLDLTDIIIRNDCLLIENDKHFKNSVIQLSTSEDPFFAIPLSKEIHGDTSELTIEINLASLTDEQNTVINKTILKPLSFVSTKELSSFNEIIQKKTEEKDKLQETVHILNKQIFDESARQEENRKKLLEENQLFLNTNKDLTFEINKLKEELKVFGNLKEQDNINLKNQQEINRILSEDKQKVDKMLEDLNSQKGLLTTTNNEQLLLIKKLELKEKELFIQKGELEEKVTKLTITSNQVQQDLLTHQQANTVLKEEKSKLDTVIEKIVEQKESLTITCSQQQQLLNEITNKKEELILENNNLLAELKKLEMLNLENEHKLSGMELEIDSLKRTNSEFVENYENKSLIQIAYKRVFK